MTRPDIQDIPAAPANICVLIGDDFDVIRGLVGCSGDVESGCLEPFHTNAHYKAYLLDVNTAYYTTKIQIRYYLNFDNYRQWKTDDKEEPTALFVCVDMNQNETDLKTFLEQVDSLNVKDLDTRSLLLFGELPCSINNADHPKSLLIQGVVDRNFIEVVKFNPNEEELEVLENDREKYGIERVWELIGIASWPSKIMKPGAGRFDAFSNSLNGLAPSNSTQKRLSVMENLSRKSQVSAETSMPEPSAEDERFIYQFLTNAVRTMPESTQVKKVPDMSIKYLMQQKERIRDGIRLSQSNYPHNCINIINPPKPLNLAETTIRDSKSSLNTRMSIVDTTKNFESDKETRSGTSINVIAYKQPEEQVSTIVQGQQSKKKKKSKNKKTSSNEEEDKQSAEQSNINKTETKKDK